MYSNQNMKSEIGIRIKGFETKIDIQLKFAATLKKHFYFLGI